MSEFLKLNGKDLTRGAILAALLVLTSSLTTIFESGNFPTVSQIIEIAKWTGMAAVSYLLKNLFSNSTNEPFKAEK
jgi:hypothetical protein